MAQQAVQHWHASEPYIKMRCGLGEAPFWDRERHLIRFVDIHRKQLHILDETAGPASLHSVDLQDAVGTTANVEGGGIIAAAKYGYALLDEATGQLEYVKRIWEASDGEGKAERMRFNDGAVDSHGRYWAGAMSDDAVVSTREPGVLFRLDGDLSLHRMVEEVLIPNGIVWALDDQSMYFTDSPTRTIWQFDFEASTGSITNRRVFFSLEEHGSGWVEESDAGPDGCCLDRDGCIWTAIYGGSKVLRISAGAEVIGVIHLGARCITCPAFVGEDLFITSASEAGDEAEFSGSVFRVHVGVQGAPLHQWRQQKPA